MPRTRTKKPGASSGAHEHRRANSADRCSPLCFLRQRFLCRTHGKKRGTARPYRRARTNRCADRDDLCLILPRLYRSVHEVASGMRSRSVEQFSHPSPRIVLASPAPRVSFVSRSAAPAMLRHALGGCIPPTQPICDTAHSATTASAPRPVCLHLPRRACCGRLPWTTATLGNLASRGELKGLPSVRQFPLCGPAPALKAAPAGDERTKAASDEIHPPSETLAGTRRVGTRLGPERSAGDVPVAVSWLSAN